MTKIDLTIMQDRLERTLQRVRERKIIIPTLAQQRDPSLVPAEIQERLKEIGLWDLHPLNLFRITWHNEPKPFGGLFGDLNYIEFPSSFTGTKARVVALVGKWFPCGVHKVGAAFGCLVPRLVTGQFDPTTQKAVWPSTGNYCRGGAYDSYLLACKSVAILPEGMSKERFEWLSNVADEVIATPGTESNVKEIFDKCWELRRSGEDLMIFNQFDEFGNYLWHYLISGDALEDLTRKLLGEKGQLAGFASATGSAGTIAAGDYLKQKFPGMKIIASEALQCPTLLNNGFGAHRIEGIGDKHVPWIHDVKDTDMVMAVDDADCMAMVRLFNEPEGRAYLVSQGMPASFVESLPLMGISSAANVVMAIKMAKYYELTSRDIVLTVFTDSMEMYGSRLEEMRTERGKAYTAANAAVDHGRHVLGINREAMLEMNYYDKLRVHNLKYYTWIEQQGKTSEELNAQWYDYDEYWGSIRSMADAIDERIEAFNARVGLL